MIRPQSHHRSRALAIASSIVVTFLAVTATLAFYLNIWQDEAYTLHTTSHGLYLALHDAIFYEAQAPLYFGSLELWRTFNESAFFARIPSIISALGTIALSWLFAERYLSRIQPWIVASAVALNPFTIWAAVEARPYSLATAMSTALLYTFFRGWIDDQIGWRSRVAFILIAIAGAYTQYYVVALVPAGIVVLIVLKRFRTLKSYLGASIVIAIFLAPIAFILPLQLNAYNVQPFVIPKLAPLAILLAIFEFIYPHGSIGSWGHRFWPNAAYFAASAVPGIIAYRRIDRLGSVSLSLVSLVIVLCLVFATLIGIGHVHVIWPRQTAVLFTITIFAVFSIISDVVPARRKLVLIAFLSIYTLLSFFALWATYHSLSKSGDWQRVGTFLEKNVSAADAVMVFDAEAELPLQYYFKRLEIIPIPRPLSFTQFNEARFVIYDEHDLAASLGNVSERHLHVWLVINDVCRTEPNFYGCNLLHNYVFRNFDIVKHVNFDRASVTEIRLRDH